MAAGGGKAFFVVFVSFVVAVTGRNTTGRECVVLMRNAEYKSHETTLNQRILKRSLFTPRRATREDALDGLRQEDIRAGTGRGSGRTDPAFRKRRPQKRPPVVSYPDQLEADPQQMEHDIDKRG